MMSTENLLGEFKEAEHSTPRSLNSSIQIELERHVSENISSGLGISMAGAIFLLVLESAQNQTFLHWNWIWLAAVSLASLTIWLWSVRICRDNRPSSSQTRALITTSSLLFAALYGAAAVIFITPDHLETSVFAAITLIALTFAWPLTHALLPIFRHLFLSLVFAPLFISLFSYQAQISPGFLVFVALTYFILNRNQLSQRRSFSWATGNMIKANEHSDVVVATSQKITSLIEQTPLGFIEWNQERKIIGWNPAATTIFGYAKEEVLGRTTEFLFDKKKSFLLQQVENDLFLFGKDFTGTAENVTRDGTMIICEWNDTPAV